MHPSIEQLQGTDGTQKVAQDQDINISKVLGQESGGAVSGFEPVGLLGVILYEPTTVEPLDKVATWSRGSTVVGSYKITPSRSRFESCDCSQGLVQGL